MHRSIARWAACLLGLCVSGIAAWAQAPALPAAVAAATTPATTPATTLAVADFFRQSAMARPVLSPSGKHLAVQVATPQGRVRLAVLAMDPPREAKLLAGFSDTDVDEIHWVNDERLVFTVEDRQSAWDHSHAPGLFAVNRDGSDLRALIQRQGSRVQSATLITGRELTPDHLLARVLRDGSSDVIVLRWHYHPGRREFTHASPLRLDTRTGRSRAVFTDSPRQAVAWVFDATGQPRLMRSIVGGELETWRRHPPAAPWQMIEKRPLYQADSGGLGDLQLGLDDQWYAEAWRGDAAGTTALFRLDAATGRPEAEPLVAVDGFDFEGGLIFDGGARRLLGVRFRADAWGTAWLSAEMQAVQARIDQRLPGLVNLLHLAECGCSRWMVVSSHSDRQPPVYWLHDRESGQLERVGQAQPGLDARHMAERDFVRFEARDGLSIPLHVTRPAGPGPWPTVLLIHGGPHVRGGDWGWEPVSQFLASRGYLVLEPEFRGSMGYGSRLFQAGWKQWGLKSQDDMVDALRWAVVGGLADAGRVCIAGGSYGGYAALMGLIRDSPLFRCGLAWMAVTDIGLMHDISWSDLSEVWRTHGMPVLVGDPVADAAQLAATSPLKQAARLNRPLLLAVGGVDQRVPPEHGRRFRSALPPSYTGLTWVEYPDEGHGLLKPETRVDFWRRVEGFLATHLAPGAAAVSSPAETPR